MGPKVVWANKLNRLGGHQRQTQATGNSTRLRNVSLLLRAGIRGHTLDFQVIAIREQVMPLLGQFFGQI